MESVGVYEAKTHLARLVERVRQGESLTITRHGLPVARLVPVPEDTRVRALQAANRIRGLRERLPGVPLADLLASIHEGHRF